MADASDNPGDLDRVPAKPARKRAVVPKHAASLLAWRMAGDEPELLMGIRAAGHKFMPSVLVFPGGRVDRADHGVRVASELRAETEALLRHRAPPSLARALAVCAARELQEETGLLLGEMRGGRLHADLAPLDYLCRAVTPATRAIRFNARFLVVRGEALGGTVAGSGELEAVRWYPLREARGAKLADITRMILGEFVEWLAVPEAARAARPRIVYRGNDNRMSDL